MNKTVLITGATRGIGKALALGFAQAGYTVYGTGRRLDHTIWAADKNIVLWQADVTEQKIMEEIISEIKQKNGKLDVLINNAGIASHTPASSLTAFEITEIVDINFKAVFHASQTYYKLHRKAGGNIINIASVLGMVGTSMASVYSGTKGAVIAMTRALSIEWANSNFRVNAICPGFIDTDMTEMIKKRESVMQKMLEFIPMKRLGKPEDLVAPALFLAGDGSAYMTGQTLVIDGGLTAM